ncbi:MAG: hypothetical protein QXX89_08030 [Ignisphaera sp.]
MSTVTDYSIDQNLYRVSIDITTLSNLHIQPIIIYKIGAEELIIQYSEDTAIFPGSCYNIVKP